MDAKRLGMVLGCWHHHPPETHQQTAHDEEGLAGNYADENVHVFPAWI
jgi:hypothetical protein